MSDSESPVVVTDEDKLRQYGVCYARVPFSKEESAKWALELSKVTPLNMAGEDGEYAFYRNILEEPDFPFEQILKSEIGETILRHFGVSRFDEIRLDDAFCVHYNTSQDDTTGAKHTDPSDITVNMCLEKTAEVRGSEVQFYGTQRLENVDPDDDRRRGKSDSFRFLANQRQGYATIHWGHHPHETMALRSGRRTNIVLTYCYTDPSRSDVAMRTCYN